MKHTYLTPEMNLIGIAHEDVLCTSAYEFRVETEENVNAIKDRVSVNKFLGQ